MKLTTKALAVAVCVGTMSNLAWGQNPPAFRSAQGGGDWTDKSTWEQENSMVPGGWQHPADHVPTSADGQITIRYFSYSVNTVYITSDVTVDQLVVAGDLTISGATLTIANGTT